MESFRDYAVRLHSMTARELHAEQADLVRSIDDSPSDYHRMLMLIDDELTERESGSAYVVDTPAQVARKAAALFAVAQPDRVF